MIDRLILSAILGTIGWKGLYPEPPMPITLQAKAKYKSMSAVCDKKKKTKTVKQMCKQWKEQQNASI
jgi:hypothetical protein